MRRLLITLLLALAMSQPAAAQDFPKLTGRVVDNANIIPPAEEAAPPAPPRHVPLVLLQDLAEDHPAVQALLAAGLDVGHLEHTSTIPADALLLHPAHEI